MQRTQRRHLHHTPAESYRQFRRQRAAGCAGQLVLRRLGHESDHQEYSGTKFALTFTYLSHLNVRIVDISTWPPTEVVPITSPPTITIGNQTTGSGAPQDSLTLKTEARQLFGLTRQFFKPPVCVQPLLFLDPITNTYSVTIKPIPAWAPDPPWPVFPVFYRLYVRPFPYTGAWILATDWTLSALSFPWFRFPFSNVGAFVELSVTWGTQWLPTDQWNPNAHAEGIPGEFFLTVDSTTQHVNAQAFIFEHLTYDLTSDETFGYFGTRQEFLVKLRPIASFSGKEKEQVFRFP